MVARGDGSTSQRMLLCLPLLAMEAFNYTGPVIFKAETAGAAAVFTRE